MKEGDIELLKKIVDFESTCNWEKEHRLGWCWRDVRIWPATLNRLCLEGYLDTLFKSNSYTGYKLTDLGNALARGEDLENVLQKPQDEKFSLPDSIFEDIIGHEDVKELLRASILAEKPIHVLLAGPPALAKTLFLWDIERAGGERAIWIVGSATSKAGLWDLVAERQPRILLIDELDKMNAADTAALLSMMEGGRLIRAKKGRELELEHLIWVVAATNKIYGLSPELLSRFAVRKLQPYGHLEYQKVVKGVLVHRENVTSNLAEEIAQAAADQAARMVGGQVVELARQASKPESSNPFASMLSQTIQPYIAEMFSRMFGMFASFGQPPGMMPPQPGVTPAGQPPQPGTAQGQPESFGSPDNQISKEEMEEIFNGE